MEKAHRLDMSPAEGIASGIFENAIGGHEFVKALLNGIMKIQDRVHGECTMTTMVTQTAAMRAVLIIQEAITIIVTPQASLFKITSRVEVATGEATVCQVKVLEALAEAKEVEVVEAAATNFLLIPRCQN